MTDQTVKARAVTADSSISKFKAKCKVKIMRLNHIEKRVEYLEHFTGMCGPCTFGEANTVAGNWGNAEK